MLENVTFKYKAKLETQTKTRENKPVTQNQELTWNMEGRNTQDGATRQQAGED